MNREALSAALARLWQSSGSFPAPVASPIGHLLAHLALKGLQRRQGEDGKWNAPKWLAAMVLA
jgi:hypothetical protein